MGKQRKDNLYTKTYTNREGKRLWFYGHSNREAQRKLVEAQLKERQGVDIGKPSQRVDKFLDAWLSTVKRKVRASTYDNYALNVARAKPCIGALKLDAISKDHIDAMYTELEKRGLKPASIQQLHRVLRAAFRTTDIIPRPPTAKATPPRVERHEMRALDVEQIRQLFQSSHNERLHALLVILTTTGIRIGEATALTWDDVDFGGSRLVIKKSVSRSKEGGRQIGETKTKRSRRTVYLVPEAIEALKHHRDRQRLEQRKAANLWTDTNLVFCNETGGLLDFKTFWQTLQRCLVAAGLPRIRVHDLRHTAASYLLGNGVNLKLVQGDPRPQFDHTHGRCLRPHHAGHAP